jgi:hypothetical protein
VNSDRINKALRILIEECGFTPSEDSKNDFRFRMHEGCTEYRFCGAIGFGGKIYNERGRLRVSCYPEDRNELRDGMIATANKLLALL